MTFPFKDIYKVRVTCEYGRKGSWSSGKHDGIDLVSDGDKTILSITDGRVIRSGWNDSWGEYVVVQMKDGRALIYAHMVKGSRKVMQMQEVKTGHPLGTMGSTGKSTGPHLHLELQKSYYKSGSVDDIAEFLGIENRVGKAKELIEVAKVPEWQIEATEEVCRKYGLDTKQWIERAKNGDTVTVGELFAILNKIK